jgi:1,2-diacylglycerol 3-beta-glucosyltransferase
MVVVPQLLVVLPILAMVRGFADLFGQSRPSGAAEVAGLALAFLGLVMGTIFFAFALRYYVATVVVLLSTSPNLRVESRASNGKGNGPSPIDHRERNGNGNGDGLSLAEQPFISVHIAVYNEKRVIERLLECCAAFEYPNYEVVIVDDSNDESVQILDRWRDRPGFKVLHRPSRDGYKGGALREALKLTDPRARFVTVFDADAMPFPDTLQRLLPHFYRVVGGRPVLRARVGAVQSYQWHVLNKSESWLTTAVRAEYAGSYMVERVYQDDLGTMKMIAGTAYMIRADLLRQLGWGTSLTEDWELTLRLYRHGYRVVYTPYAEVPAECVGTFARLARQRMRWAEGHCHNVKLQFLPVLASPRISPGEKLEFLYYAGYYLQAVFFIVGTLAWMASEIGFRVEVPEWTATLGWSLLFTNLFSLPLMNLSGLILEEAPRKDLGGVLGAILLSYLLVPFQAYASLKGFLERREGPWFRTPKTGRITDPVGHLRRLRALRLRIFGNGRNGNGDGNGNGNGNGDGNGKGGGHRIRADARRPRRASRRVGWVVIAAMILALLVWALAGRETPQTEAAGTTIYLHGTSTFTLTATAPAGSTVATSSMTTTTTRTWAGTPATTGSQLIAATDIFVFHYWTTAGGTSLATVTFGYSSSSTCATTITTIFTHTNTGLAAGGSGTATPNMSPAADVTVPSGVFFCWRIQVTTVTGGGCTLNYDATTAPTNLTSSDPISIPESALPLTPLAPLIPLMIGVFRRRALRPGSGRPG